MEILSGPPRQNQSQIMERIQQICDETSRTVRGNLNNYIPRGQSTSVAGLASFKDLKGPLLQKVTLFFASLDLAAEVVRGLVPSNSPAFQRAVDAQRRKVHVARQCAVELAQIHSQMVALNRRCHVGMDSTPMDRLEELAAYTAQLGALRLQLDGLVGFYLHPGYTDDNVAAFLRGKSDAESAQALFAQLQRLLVESRFKPLQKSA